MQELFDGDLSDAPISSDGQNDEKPATSEPLQLRVESEDEENAVKEVKTTKRRSSLAEDIKKPKVRRLQTSKSIPVIIVENEVKEAEKVSAVEKEKKQTPAEKRKPKSQPPRPSLPIAADPVWSILSSLEDDIKLSKEREIKEQLLAKEKEAAMFAARKKEEEQQRRMHEEYLLKRVEEEEACRQFRLEIDARIAAMEKGPQLDLRAQHNWMNAFEKFIKPPLRTDRANMYKFYENLYGARAQKKPLDQVSTGSGTPQIASPMTPVSVLSQCQ